MRETETFEYIRRKYPDKEETWRKVTRLVKFDENLEVKSVHDFNMECYISSFGRLIRNGILCNMAYGDKYDISSMFTDTDGSQVRFKRHQIVMQTFFMGDRRRYDTVDHMENKPDISYRTFMSNMDDELLKSFHVELQEVWE